VAERVPARLSAKEGRSFGLTVGGAFAVLGALLWWRGRSHTLIGVFESVAVALIVAALLAPAHLGPVQRGWMKLAETISKVTTPIVLGIVYALVFVPIGLAMRVFGRDPLRPAPRGAPSFWLARSLTDKRSDLRRQF